MWTNREDENFHLRGIACSLCTVVTILWMVSCASNDDRLGGQPKTGISGTGQTGGAGAPANTDSIEGSGGNTAAPPAAGDTAAPPAAGDTTPPTGGAPGDGIIDTLCGNGTIDSSSGEDCDGADLGGTSCAALMGGTGTLSCSTDCRFDLTSCTEVAPPTGNYGGSGAAGAAGTVPPPTGGAAGTDTTPPPPPGSKDPRVPEIIGDCPNFVNGTITYMGLGGIVISAGAKPPGPTAPIVFYWHGTASTSLEYGMMAAPVNSGVVAEGGVLVSFSVSSGGNCMYSGTMIFCDGDFNITDQIYACAVRDHNVDPRRVYVTGCSAGGLFSAAMGALRSSYVAAVAPNSGGFVFPVPFENDYTPALMTVHGGAIDMVGVSFPQTSATADASYKNRGGFVVNCDHGGMHCGGALLYGNVWDFFKAHPYGVDPYPWAGGLPAGFSAQCRIY